MMARIRTIKPEFFKHETLFDAEQETGLPLRLAFAGLWTVCDREGRFEWRPRAIKTDAMPYDDVDFSRVLDALTTRGFVVRYRVDGKEFGHVPGFSRHQVINGRETDSKLPPPPELIEYDDKSTPEPRVNHASTTRHDLAHGEGKGREREKEKEGEVKNAAAAVREGEFEIEGLIPKITFALGFDHLGMLPKYWASPDAVLIVSRWETDLSLSHEEIVQVAVGSMRQHGSPANGPKALTSAMQAYAAARDAPALKPESGRSQRPAHEPAINENVKRMLNERLGIAEIRQ